MSTPENIFRGEATKIAGVDIDSPLSTATAQTCEYYVNPYQIAAKKEEDNGDIQKAVVYRLLQVIVGFHPSFDTPARPFVPFMQLGNKRSIVPTDLTASDVEVVRELAKQTVNPALQARLNDVLWELRKDHIAGAKAAECYATAADALNVKGSWTFAVKSFHRCLYLASKFGRDKKLFVDSANTLVSGARRAAISVDDFHSCQLMRVMLAWGVGEPSEFAALASSIATAAQGQANYRKAKAYWEVEAEWQKYARNASGEQKARLAAAEASVSEAKSRSHGTGASFMAAASLLSESIEALRQAGATKERIAELRGELNNWQERSLTEFQTHSTGVDISNLVFAARDHVKCNDFRQAVLRLAFGQDLANPKFIKEEVLKAMDEAPLGYMMDSLIVDHQGRTTARKDGLLNLKGEALNMALEVETFSHASHAHWPLRVQAFIEPARVQILNDHKPTFHDLLFIVSNNAFIPPGHEGIFLRGLHAGFHGDFLVATHLLTLQIENSLRYVLESHGVDVSNLMSDGTQPVKVLGAIFDMDETKRIFGEQLCFELRGCLIEKAGYDFRNRVAHGFVSEAECYSPPGLTVWWLVLRICLIPLFQSIEAKKTEPSGQGTPPNPSNPAGGAPPLET
jgi:hypothetical protein